MYYLDEQVQKLIHLFFAMRYSLASFNLIDSSQRLRTILCL